VSRKGLRRKEKVIVFIVFPWRAKGELEQRRESYGDGKGLSLHLQEITPAEGGRTLTGCTHPNAQGLSIYRLHI